MINWREKAYSEVVGAVFLLEGVALIFSIYKYNVGFLWQVQFATWGFFVASLVVLAEKLYSKKLTDCEKKNKLEKWKDKYYDKGITAFYIIEWLILMLGDFQYDIGQYKLINVITWGTIGMAIMLGFDLKRIV